MSKNNSECICRICLQNCDNIISLYEEVSDFQLKLSELLENLCDIKIDSNDIYPKHICNACVNELLITVKFIEKCKKTQEILSYFVPSDSDEFVINNENNRIDENDVNDNDNDDDDDEDIMTYYFPTNNSNYDTDKIEAVDDDYSEITENQKSKTYDKNKEYIENLQNYDNDNNIVEWDTIDCITYDCDDGNVKEIESNEKIRLQQQQEQEDEEQAVEQAYDKQSINEQNLKIIKNKKKNNYLPLGNLIKSQKLNCNCDACGAGFKHLNNLRKHLETHGFNEIYECAICLCPFSNYNKLEEHSLSVHPKTLQINSNDNKNEEEGEKYDATKLSYKNKQKNINNDDNIFRIVDCDNELEEYFVMKDGKKYRSCRECKKLFVSKSALNTHIRIHTGDRPFKCSQCSKGFTTHGGLVLHLRRHTGLRPFICNICDKSFVESSNLKVHMRTHTGEKPHKCTICGRNFSRVFLLQIHQRTHTGEKPYNCPYCDKAFAQQGDLSTHKKIHTGERPHKCKKCGKGFIKNSALNIHMKKHPKLDNLSNLYNSNNNNSNELPLLLLKQEINEKNYDDQMLSINLNIDNANECDDTNNILLDESHKLEMNAYKSRLIKMETISDRNDGNKICLIDDLDSVMV